jgi:ankyrin repeat protein
LHYAINSQNLDLVQLLVQHGAAIDQKCLSLAVKVNDTAIVKLLGKEKDNLDFSASSLINVVLNAENKNVDLLDYLLKMGSDPNLLCENVTNLQQACIIDCLDYVQCLLQNGANVNGRGTNGTTPLMSTYSNTDLQIATLLVNSGANVNDKDDQGATALYYASSNGNLNLVQCLLQNGANVNGRETKNGITPLMSTYSNTDLQIATLLVNSGANVNDKDDQGVTALFYASSNGNLNLVQYLHKNGADISIESNARDTALTMAHQHISVMTYLVGNGADVNHKSGDNRTALFNSCLYGNYDTALYLIEKGAEINTTTESKRLTPLHIAALMGHEEIVKLLLVFNADITITNISGDTAIVSVVENNNLEIVKWFAEEFTDNTTGNNNGITVESKFILRKCVYNKIIISSF